MPLITCVIAVGRSRLSVNNGTAAVILPSPVLDRLNSEFLGWDAATSSGSTFTFFQRAVYGSSPRGSENFTIGTLQSVVPGASVLIDDGTGTGTWRLGTVISNGFSVSSPNGDVPLSAMAATFASLNNQGAPPVGAKLALRGQAADSSLWFDVVGGGNVPGFGGTFSLGAAAVDVSGQNVSFPPTSDQLAAAQWQVLQL